MQTHLQARLTMYALLSEMERDLRDLVESQLGGGLTSDQVLNPELHKKSSERFTKDNPTVTTPPGLCELLAFTDLGDLEQVLRSHKASLTEEGRQLLQMIGAQFSEVVVIRNRVMHSRPINFKDLPTVIEFSEHLLGKFSHLFRKLAAATDRLRADPSYVLGLAIPKPYDDQGCFHNLPFPDFDETGFIGRENDLRQLHKNIRGPFPVLSVLGEGGLGKTALAQKAAYEILDQPDNPFDAIIWSSSKSAHLTPHDIREIENAIRDSIGLLQHASESLGGLETEDPVENIYAYMREYKVLLILDNLETVLDDRIRNFVQGIPEGSKIVLTSRIGLQADLPLTLRAMEESVDLLRAVAEVRRVETLVKTNNTQLKVYTKRLHQNPLAIKWFVSAVQSGLRPEEVLQEQGVLLEYCINNVYKHLSDDSRFTLSVFQTTGKSLDIARLVALSGMESARVKSALLQLDGANMITMKSTPVGATYETAFAINHLALTFMNKHHVVPPAQRNEIEKRRRRFMAMIEEVRGTTKSAPFSRRTIRVKTETEIMVAGILLSALDAVKDRNRPNYARADDDIEQAKSIAPGFFEVYRVEAFVRYSAKRVGEAVTAYETAVELEPNHAPLRYWFAQMLLRENNFPDARTQLKRALEIAPDEPVVKLEQGRLELYERQFAIARQIIDGVLGTEGVNDTYVRMAWDLRIQSYLREAEHELLKNRSPANALPKYEQAKNAYEAVPGDVNDLKIKQSVAKAYKVIALCEKNLREGDLASRAYAVREWSEKVKLDLVQTEALVLERKGSEIVGASFVGVISRINPKGFGFLKVIDPRIARDVFFHRSDVLRNNWGSANVGTRVTFVMGKRHDGRLHAKDIELK